MTNTKNINKLLSLMRNKILLVIIIIYLRKNITLRNTKLRKNYFSLLFCCQRFLTCYDFENNRFVQNKERALTGLAIQMGDTFNISTSDLKTSDCYVWGMLKKALHFSYQSRYRSNAWGDRAKKLNMQAFINKQACLND